jgi:hypothetical protein
MTPKYTAPHYISFLWPAVARDPDGADGLVRDAKEQVGSVYDGKLQTAAALQDSTFHESTNPRIRTRTSEPANPRPEM